MLDATELPPHSVTSMQQQQQLSSSEDDTSSLPPHPQSSQSGEISQKNKKRKRTSPEDHNTLENEYKRNPKPDKTARLEIVQKVSLSEKEVQIWFQNKRQSARRKSRPLLPHELEAFGLGGMAALSSDPISSSLHESMSPSEHSRSDVSGPDSQDPAKERHVNEIQRDQKVIKLELDDSTPPSEADRISHHLAQSTYDLPSLEHPTQPTEEANAVSEVSETSTVMPLSTRPPINRSSSLNAHLETPLSCQEDTNSLDSNAKSSSRMRLSLSMEGRADLQEISPHKAATPRPSSFDFGTVPRRIHGLQRSQSALPLGASPKNIAANTRAPRLLAGRSRDARAWEFYADIGTRNEVNLPTERHTSNGSAAAAISLLRSASNSALNLNQNKRNTTSTRQEDSKTTKKPKLARASSSLARLQGIYKMDSIKPHGNKPSSNLATSPNGDSDKENWVSGENGSDIRRTTGTVSHAPKQDRRRVLEDTVNMPKFGTKLGGRRNKKMKLDAKPPSIFEDDATEENVDPEVERFMRGEISPSKRGDLDCVQGLLSLSQGNWR